MDSILKSIKKLLGIHPDYTQFDIDLIIHINSVFVILQQLNIGPPNGFLIEDDSATWSDYVTGLDEIMVRTYVYLKVRLLFDPPTSGSLIESINAMIAELEWRLYVVGDEKKTEGGE